MSKVRYYKNLLHGDHIKIFNTPSGILKFEKIPGSLSWRVFKLININEEFHYLGLISCNSYAEKVLYDTVRLEYPSYLSK